MTAELIEIQTFLKKYDPFTSLPPESISRAASAIEISYHRAGSTIIEYGDDIHHLHIVRNGVVELLLHSGELYNRLDRGNIFGEMGLMMNNKARFTAKAIEDTLIYRLEGAVFYQLCELYSDFFDYVEFKNSHRLRHAVTTSSYGNDLNTSKLKHLLNREAVMLQSSDSIRHAARVMADENVSAVIVVGPDQDDQEPDQESDQEQSRGLDEAANETAELVNERFLGILTERDLIIHVVAQGLDPDQPVRSIMSRDLVALDHNDYVFEAIMTMLRRKIRHLPVLRDKRPIGIVEIADIVRHESKSILLLVNTILSQSSVEDLSRLKHQVRESYVRMVNEGADSRMVGTAMSTIGRSFIQHLAELGERELGPPPIPYCIIALGSMARDEQLAVTDQDNAFILGEDYTSHEHGEYFERLATFLCDGLAACGYEYCPGEIMATNEQWRKTLSQWQECFSEWIDTPEPQALLNSSIFFDLDGVWGQTSWAEKLKTYIARRGRKNTRFLACLAGNAVKRTPPLGFFKQFVMETDGRHKNIINLKRRGTAPLTDLVRVHALAVGSRAQNTFDRLDDVMAAEILPKDSGPVLRDAMEYISSVRIRHQAHALEIGEEPDNTVEPAKISDFERRNLKEAFQALSKAQNFIKYRYSAKRDIR